MTEEKEKPSCTIIGVEDLPERGHVGLVLNRKAEECDWRSIVAEPIRNPHFPNLENLKKCDVYIGQAANILVFSKNPEDYNKRQKMMQSLRPKLKQNYPPVNWKYNPC